MLRHTELFADVFKTFTHLKSTLKNTERNNSFLYLPKVLKRPDLREEMLCKDSLSLGKFVLRHPSCMLPLCMQEKYSAMLKELAPSKPFDGLKEDATLLDRTGHVNSNLRTADQKMSKKTK